MKIYKTIIAILILLFVQQSADSQQIQQLSLEESVQIALEKNFDIQISQKNIESAQLNNSWANAGMFPSINIGLTQTNRFDNRESQMDDSRNEITNASIKPYIQLQWMLFNGLSVYINKDKLALIEQLSEGNAAVVVENKIQATVLAYYQTLRNQERLGTIDKVKKLSRDRYNYVETKKNFGSAVSYDVLQAKNAYLSDSSNYLLQSLEVKKSQLQLNLLMGVDKESVYELTTEFNAVTQDYIYSELEDKMLSNNKTLLNQYINQEILQKEIKSAKANVWPSLSMNAGSDYASNYVRYSGTDPNSSYSYDFYVNFQRRIFRPPKRLVYKTHTVHIIV